MEVKYFVVRPGTFRLDGGAMFGITPKPLWQKVAPPDQDNRINLALRSWLIKTTNKIILVDVGIGDYHGSKFDHRFAVEGGQDPIKMALQQADGLIPEDITDVVISHLHFDHAGGLTHLQNETIHSRFPNSRLHLHREHYAYALNPTERDAGSFHKNYFLPVIQEHEAKGLMIWHQGTSGTVLSDHNYKLQFKTSMGHTPHLMHPFDSRYFYMADLVPTAHHIHIPWIMAYDIAPGVSTNDKRQLLNFCIENKLTLLFEHDPDNWGATIRYDKTRDQFFCQNIFQQQTPGSCPIPSI
ncbi:MAG: MBL fold metallo-hydrolase [Bdellovibrio sp.]|nr:MBL fold metallo-hydrolase [Bdellovibrio sp.]